MKGNECNYRLLLSSDKTIQVKTGTGQNKISRPPEVFCKKGVLINFVKFAGKHLCQSLFFNKV